jgi:hypothetical protein
MEDKFIVYVIYVGEDGVEVPLSIYKGYEEGLFYVVRSNPTNTGSVEDNALAAYIKKMTQALNAWMDEQYHDIHK